MLTPIYTGDNNIPSFMPDKRVTPKSGDKFWAFRGSTLRAVRRNGELIGFCWPEDMPKGAKTENLP